MFEIIYYNEAVLNSYLFRIFQVSGITDTVRLFIPVMVQSLSRIEYQSHYREQLPKMKKFYSGQFRIYCPEKIRDYISRITSGMSARKLFLFQTYIIRTQCPELIEGGVSDIDVKTAGSVSSQKEGAEIGFNKKAKGKPCFQFSASFIGRIFVEGKLFPPQRVFQSWIRAVSRRIFL